MKLLNLSCGSNRHGGPWTNLDYLLHLFSEGSNESKQLRNEPNYVDHDIHNPLPFPENSFDGILASHIIEHFDCHEAVRILTECKRILKEPGLIVVSVPDAGYFLSVYDRDIPENAIDLFGEPIHDNWQPNFFRYALFHRDHKQILCGDSLKCLLKAAGFDSIYGVTWVKDRFPAEVLPVMDKIQPLLNRRKFSVELMAVKQNSDAPQAVLPVK